MLILIAGLPGSGKTYFAKALCKKLEAKWLSSDVIRTQLELRGKYSEEVKALVYEEMLRLSQQYIAEGLDVIVDATFYQKTSRDLFSNIVEGSEVPCFIIEVKAAEETIKKRLQKKREYSEADFEVYQKVKKAFEPIQKEHLVLWSDKMELDEMIEKAMSYINRIPEK